MPSFPQTIAGILGTNPLNLGSIGGTLWRTYQTAVLNKNPPPTSKTGWKPRQWARGSPEITYISASTKNDDGTFTDTDYFFDAVFKISHTRDVVITKQPVQTGAPIADHAYVLPARVELEIGMSDAMAKYSTDPKEDKVVVNKSVNAYQALVDLQQKRGAVRLLTRLMAYENMVITSIRATDDNRTIQALRATIVLEQIFPAQLSTTGVSSKQINGIDPDLSEDTQSGTVLGTPPSVDTDSFGVATPTNVPYPGSWSSSPIVQQVQP